MQPDKKKTKVAESGKGEGSGDVDENLASSISKIEEIQKELKKINAEEDNKVLEVLQEYSKICREIYTRRNEVLVTMKEFWSTVFSSHPVLREFVNREDLQILSYLISLDVEDRPKQGFSITFNFSPNPYFENEKLTKTFSFPDEATIVVTGATIKWKEGLDTRLEDTSLFLWLTRSEQVPSSSPMDKIACIIEEFAWPDPLKILMDNRSLYDGRRGVQNADEEAGAAGQNDVEIGQQGDGEGRRIDYEADGLYLYEIEEQEDYEEGEQGDGEIEQVEDDEEGGQEDK